MRALASRGAALPLSLGEIAAGRSPSRRAPPYPSAALGPSVSVFARVQTHVRGMGWRGQSICMVRRAFGTSATSPRRAFFEPLAPLERKLGPVFLRVLRSRGSDLRSGGAVETPLATVAHAAPGGLGAADLNCVLSGYVRDLPDSAATALCRNPEWAKMDGLDVSNPFGVLSGAVFAAAARVSWGERAKWLNAVNWNRVPRLSRVARLRLMAGRIVSTRVSPVSSRLSIRLCMTRRVATPPSEPGGRSHVWAVNSFSRLPARGSVFSGSVAQQIGYRTPLLEGLDAALRSGPWVAATFCGSAATTPGASPSAGGEFVGPDDALMKGDTRHETRRDVWPYVRAAAWFIGRQ